MGELVSIITPSFNSARYIVATIESVQNQTYPFWEMLIVDDGSSDETVAVVNAICQKEPRVKLFSLARNVGPAKARNVAIENATGDYMAFLDADDMWFPDFIENSVRTIKETGVNFVFSSFKRCDENVEFIYSDFIAPERVTYTDVLKTNSIGCLTAFINVKVLGKKFMPEIRKRQDMGLWLQYLKEIPFAYGIKEPKAIYRIRENSLSGNKKNLIKYQWQFYREVEKLNTLQSSYYMLHWMYRGFMKYRN